MPRTRTNTKKAPSSPYAKHVCAEVLAAAREEVEDWRASMESATQVEAALEELNDELSAKVPPTPERMRAIKTRAATLHVRARDLIFKTKLGERNADDMATIAVALHTTDFDDQRTAAGLTAGVLGKVAPLRDAHFDAMQKSLLRSVWLATRIRANA